MAHPERENYYKQNFEVIVQGRGNGTVGYSLR
jgi:hypothetical protein